MPGRNDRKRLLTLVAGPIVRCAGHWALRMDGVGSVFLCSPLAALIPPILGLVMVTSLQAQSTDVQTGNVERDVESIGAGADSVRGKAGSSELLVEPNGVGRNSDALSLNLLVGESVVASNAAKVCAVAQGLGPEDRFEYLLHWVLPFNSAGVRLEGEFRRGSALVGQIEQASDDLAILSRSPEAGWLRVPARGLIKAGVELGRLQQIQRRLASKPSSEEGQVLAVLLAIAQDDVQSVADHLDSEFLAVRATSPGSTVAEPAIVKRHWHDLLILWAASENAATSHLISDDLFGMYPALRLFHADQRLDVVYDYLRLLAGRQHAGLDELPSQWDGFGIGNARTHAMARPLTRFRSHANIIKKISGHERDLLAWRAPLGGTFEVSSVAASQAGSFTDLQVGGTAVHPSNSGDSSIRTLSGISRSLTFDPPLEEVESESMGKVRRIEGATQHEFNGRLLWDSNLFNRATPWIAFSSWRGTQSEVVDVHLQGTPETPTEIDLLSDDLNGWCSYYAQEHPLENWQLQDSNELATLVGHAERGVPGSYEESLLRYVRPFNWDFEIAYEFEYQPARVHVHPALGRLAFLIQPDGVFVHRLSDGRYERSLPEQDARTEASLRPDNAIRLSGSAASVNLLDGWNQLVLSSTQREIEIRLNGERVARFQMPASGGNVFGLFHYRDQTRANVRRVKLRGDWQAFAPRLGYQPGMNSAAKDVVEHADRLPEPWLVDLTEGVDPKHLFVEGDQDAFRELPQGVAVKRDEDGGIYSLKFNGVLDGDFDVIARYRELEISPGPVRWHCGVGLECTLDNNQRDRVLISRRRDRMQGKHYVSVGQKVRTAGGGHTWLGGGSIVDESTSGRLRLVRIGNRIIGLHAISDSEHYRIVHDVTVSPGPLEVQGLRLFTEVGAGSKVSAIWESIQVRAESLDLLLPDDSEPSVETLTGVQQGKPVENIAFNLQSLQSQDVISRIPEESSLLTDEEGLRIEAIGTEAPARCMLYKRVDLGADFDITAIFDMLTLERGDRDEPSEVVLQIMLQPILAGPTDSLRAEVHEASLLIKRFADGVLFLRPRVVARDIEGRLMYRPIRSLPMSKANALRIVQRDQTLYFMTSTTETDQFEIVARYPLQSDMQATSVYLWTIATGYGQRASVLWKRLRLAGSPPVDDVFRFLQSPFGQN